MKAQVVLGDCRKALELVEDAHDEQEFRVQWVGLVALLRAVGHVLRKVDAPSSPALRGAVERRWSDWKRDRDRNRVFWEFIEAERNSVLKTYEMGFQPGDVQMVVQQSSSAQMFTLDDCIYKPLADGPFAGQDGRDVARDAIAWWEEQLTEIASVEG